MSHRITEFPSLLEFLGYACVDLPLYGIFRSRCFSFYFPGFLVGPYLTYNEYQALVTGSLYKDAETQELNFVNEAEHLSQRLVPHGRKRVAYRKMFNGLFFLLLFVLFYPEFNHQYAVTDEFESRGLLSR